MDGIAAGAINSPCGSTTATSSTVESQRLAGIAWAIVGKHDRGLGAGTAGVRKNPLHVLRPALAQVQQQGVYRPRGGIRNGALSNL